MYCIDGGLRASVRPTDAGFRRNPAPAKPSTTTGLGAAHMLPFGMFATGVLSLALCPRTPAIPRPIHVPRFTTY